MRGISPAMKSWMPCLKGEHSDKYMIACQTALCTLVVIPLTCLCLSMILSLLAPCFTLSLGIAWSCLVCVFLVWPCTWTSFLCRFHSFLLYLGYDMHAVRDVKVTGFCRILREFALEYRTCRERVLQQRKKRAAYRERNKTRGKMITEVMWHNICHFLSLACLGEGLLLRNVQFRRSCKTSV